MAGVKSNAEPFGISLSAFLLGCALESESIDPCPAIIIGNGGAPAMEFADGHFRMMVRQLFGRFQAILKDLIDDVGHPFATGVV